MLAGQPDGQVEVVLAALRGPESRRVALAEPIPVVVFYATVEFRDGRP